MIAKSVIALGVHPEVENLRPLEPRGQRYRWPALGMIALWYACTIGWWLFAFARMEVPPPWLVQARSICFGTLPNGLPDAAGWIALVLEPAALLAAMWIVWGDELRAALAHASGRRSARTPRRWGWPIAALALAAAAAGASAAYILEPRPKGEVTAAEINGKAWHVNFGELHIQIDDKGNAYGVYDQGQGIQIGTFAHGRWKGWWCQAPSRQPPDDAGTFELHFVRGDDRILAEGVYKYGDGRDTPWRNDFYGVSLTTPPSYALEQRLLHHEGCPGH